MVPTMLKRVVMCAVLTAWMLGVSGCVKQSEYDAKVAELQPGGKGGEGRGEGVATPERLDAAKSEVEKAEQAKKDAEARIKAMEQENAELKDRVKSR